MAARFQTTRWSVVLQAGAEGEASREALAELCEAYWYPVYGFVRSQGHGHEDARDLTQSYFATLLDKEFLKHMQPERGRFRSFLFASIRNFLSHRRDERRALKRGGGRVAIALDADRGEEFLASERTVAGRSPERSFEVRWARTVVRRAIERLEREFVDAGQAGRFALLRGSLIGDAPTLPYAEIAERLELSENGVKTLVRRLRKRFGVVLRAEVAQTLGGREDVDEELRYLLHVLEDA